MNSRRSHAAFGQPPRLTPTTRIRIFSQSGTPKPRDKPSSLLTAPITPEILASLRQAQQDLEIAAEALDAEPPPRVCSPIVYDPTTKLYAMFGGDHFDYLTNDTWVFDLAKRRWFQRHPAAAPAPRADHKLRMAGAAGAEDGPAREDDPALQGKIIMTGGYVYSSKTDYGSNPYSSVTDGDWTYDIAKNVWSPAAGNDKAAMLPPDTRVYRTGGLYPRDVHEGRQAQRRCQRGQAEGTARQRVGQHEDAEPAVPQPRLGYCGPGH